MPWPRCDSEALGLSLDALDRNEVSAVALLDQAGHHVAVAVQELDLTLQLPLVHLDSVVP